jgi:hypothetical protein
MATACKCVLRRPLRTTKTSLSEKAATWVGEDFGVAKALGLRAKDWETLSERLDDGDAEFEKRPTRRRVSVGRESQGCQGQDLDPSVRRASRVLLILLRIPCFYL